MIFVIIWEHKFNNNKKQIAMDENGNNSLGEVLKRIRRGDIRRQIRYDEETGDFVIEDADAPIEEGSQDATSFAGDGYA